MANIESKLTTIKSASGGEDVRDAIIGALRDINNDVPADMSNPKQKKYSMPPASDLTVPLNPPELISQIIVTQPNSGGKSTTLQDITITENGEYPTDDEGYDPNKENRYYSKVTVKVPQLANAVLDLEEEITQNGTYSAPADWGVDGIRTFTVNVSGATGDGPFKVEFYDKPQTDPTATVIYTEIVSKNGSTSCTLLDGTTSGGLYFKGWNPSPSGVTRDLKCYPVYGDIIINPGEIPDGWDVICSKKGAGYPLLSTKPLSFAIVLPPETLLAEWIACKSGNPNDTTQMKIKTSYNGGTQSICQVSCDMVKVAEGESGSTSTWISTGCIDFSISGSASFLQYGFVNDGSVTWDGPVNIGNCGTNMLICNRADWVNSINYSACLDWGNSMIRSFLNNLFLSNLPEPLIRSIVQVNKSYKGWSTLTSSATRIEKTSLDKIWVPSMKEFHTLMEAYSAYTDDTYPSSPLSAVEEINGIDYSVNYAPTWPSAAAPGWWVTRTMVSHSNGGTLPMWMCANSSTKYYGSWQRWSGNSNNVPFGFCL